MDQHIPAAGRLFAGGQKLGRRPVPAAAAEQLGPAGIGQNANVGPGGGGLSCTPPAVGQGTWGVKRVLGEVPVAADGSVAFEAPVRTPVYFQLLDAKGRMVQTMRSWTLLQPGETASCIGCHESANLAPDFRASARPDPRR